MTDCPPQLRGDLSKWLCEINTGVYVGHASSRVRDAIWNRVCQNLKNGRATMVFTTSGEQKMDFRVHNTAWTPVDFEGIKLMRRPLPQAPQMDETLKPGFSKAAKRQMAQHRQSVHEKPTESYVVIDLETTGLDQKRDQIIEYGAIKVKNGEITETFSRLVRCDKSLPHEVVELTGITDAMLEAQGSEPSQALADFLGFIGQERLVGYNISFDMNFLHMACNRFEHPAPANRCADLLSLARRRIYGITNYKLTTLAEHFSLPTQTAHRALEDCLLIHAIYRNLQKDKDNEN